MQLIQVGALAKLKIWHKTNLIWKENRVKPPSKIWYHLVNISLQINIKSLDKIGYFCFCLFCYIVRQTMSSNEQSLVQAGWAGFSGVKSISCTLPWTCQGFSRSPESICFQFIKHIFPHFKIKVAKSTLRWARKRLTPLFSAPRQCVYLISVSGKSIKNTSNRITILSEGGNIISHLLWAFGSLWMNLPI